MQLPEERPGHHRASSPCPRRSSREPRPGSDGFNFSVSYPLKRHAFQRVGVTYSWTKSSITAFSSASQTFFQTIAFRSGVQGSNPLAGIINSSIGLSYADNT